MTRLINEAVRAGLASGEISGDLDGLLCNEGFIEARTGICERRFVVPGQASSDLAVGALQSCERTTGSIEGDGSFLRIATVTPDYPASPPTAAVVQEAMGWPCAHPDGRLIDRLVGDGSAACTSFVTELALAEALLRSGNRRAGYVVGADVMSTLPDPCDRAVRIILGDGAFALQLGVGEEDEDCFLPGGKSFFFGSDGSMADLIKVPAGGSRRPVGLDDLRGAVPRLAYLHMQGNEVFKKIVRRVTDEIVLQALAKVGLQVSDIDLFVFHQANLRMIDAVTKRLEIEARTFNNIDRFGNTTSASIGLCLAEAHAKDRLKAGMRVMLVGFGGGFTWGTCILRWPDLPVCSFL
ncbi:MAG: ketoacyl-ACP synthase III [Candidatus Nomurabacteria bacterium]|nr:MAG: ketoacyl-ACP synthase III [Candidatus Nomurabacteria bacterium]